jgi:hypothetical protein
LKPNSPDLQAQMRRYDYSDSAFPNVSAVRLQGGF